MGPGDHGPDGTLGPHGGFIESQLLHIEATMRSHKTSRRAKTIPRAANIDSISFPRAKTAPRGSKINLSQQEREARDFQRSIVADFFLLFFLSLFFFASSGVFSCAFLVLLRVFLVALLCVLGFSWFPLGFD